MAHEFNKKVFGERLKHLMENFNETTYSLGKKFNLSPPTISRYTRGEMMPKMTTVTALAEYFNVSPLWLSGASVSIYEREILEQPDGFDTPVPISVFKQIKYQLPVFSNEKTDSPLYLPMNKVSKWGAVFAMLMPDDSMAPTLEKGDALVIKLNTFLRGGDLTALHVNHSDLMIRRVIFDKTRIILQPHNFAYNAQVYSLKQDDVQILGSVIYKRHVSEHYFEY